MLKNITSMTGLILVRTYQMDSGVENRTLQTVTRLTSALVHSVIDPHNIYCSTSEFI